MATVSVNDIIMQMQQNKPAPKKTYKTQAEQQPPPQQNQFAPQQPPANLMRGQQAPLPGQQQPTTVQDIMMMMSKPEQQPETIDASKYGEFMTTPGMQTGQFDTDTVSGWLKETGTNLKIAAEMMLTADEDTQRDIIENNYPGVKTKKAKTTEGEEVVVIDLPDGRRTILNKPEMSYQDYYSFLGDMALYAPAAGAPGLVTGVGKKLAVGGLAAGATETARQGGLQMLDSEQSIDPVEVGTAVVTGGASELAGPALRAVAKKIPLGKRSAAKVLDVGEEQVREATRGSKITEKAGKELGIDFLKAQKTGLFSDVAETAYIASLPESAQKGMNFFNKQNKQTYNAISNFLEDVAPRSRVGGAGAKIRSAAQKAIAAQKEIRKEATEKLYNEAKKDKSKYNFNNVLEYISEEIPDSVGTLKSKLNRVKKDIAVEGGITVRKAHNIKKMLNGEMAKAYKKGDVDLAGDLKILRDKVREGLWENSQLYKNADAKYAEMSPAITELEESIVGQIAKYDDKKIGTISQQIFNPEQGVTNPEYIKKAKDVFEAVDPEAWQEILRTELERGFQNIKYDPSSELADNIPGQVYKEFFSKPKKRNVIMSAMNPEQKKRFTYLRIATQRAAKARPGGSMTQFNKQIEEGLRKGVLSRITALTSPGETVRGAAQESIRRKNINVLSDILLNPKWTPDFEKLRRMDIESPQAGRLFERIYKAAAKAIEKDKGTGRRIAGIAKPAAQAYRSNQESPLSGKAK